MAPPPYMQSQTQVFRFNLADPLWFRDAAAELQVNNPGETAVPQWLWICYLLCTTLLVSVHAFAIMVSTYILPNVDAVIKMPTAAKLAESPHVRLKTFVEVSWIFSNLFGLFLFLIELTLLCWVKFWDFYVTAAIAATAIVVPILFLFVLFAYHSYISIVKQKFQSSIQDVHKLELMKKDLDLLS